MTSGQHVVIGWVLGIALVALAETGDSGAIVFLIAGFGLPLHLVMLRLFRRPAAYGAMALVAFFSISGALVVASVEEMLFVAKHRQAGVGPTPRWTMPHHWMSYDAENHKLEGSD